eukprot:2099132-Prymnesium_polylepis.1
MADRRARVRGPVGGGPRARPRRLCLCRWRGLRRQLARGAAARAGGDGLPNTAPVSPNTAPVSSNTAP